MCLGLRNSIPVYQAVVVVAVVVVVAAVVVPTLTPVKKERGEITNRLPPSANI